MQNTHRFVRKNKGQAMKKLTFELEFITPAFIGRVDPKNAGLRSASFTGLLRWWYRKILQAKINSTDSIYEE